MKRQPLTISDQTVQLALQILGRSYSNSMHMVEQYEKYKETMTITDPSPTELIEGLRQHAYQLHDAYDQLLNEYVKNKDEGTYLLSEQTFSHMFIEIRDKSEQNNIDRKSYRRLAQIVEQNYPNDPQAGADYHKDAERLDHKQYRYDQVFEELTKIHKSFPFT